MIIDDNDKRDLLINAVNEEIRIKMRGEKKDVCLMMIVRVKQRRERERERKIFSNYIKTNNNHLVILYETCDLVIQG